MYCNIGTVMSKMKFNGMQYSILGMCFFPVARLIYENISKDRAQNKYIVFMSYLFSQTN
jgi:hypothetical protein